MNGTVVRLLCLVAVVTLGLGGCGQALPTATPPGAGLPPANSPVAASSPIAAATAAPPTATATAAATPAPSASPATATAAPTIAPAALTAAEVYRRTEQALARPGMLYHATSHWESESGTGTPLRGAFTLEQWVDAGRDVAREERRMGQLIEVTLVTATGRYRRESGSPSGNGQVSRGEPPVTCYGTGIAAAAVLACHSGPLLFTPPIAVEEGRYAGRAAIVLVATVNVSGETPRTVTSRLYLDADTFLPLAGESDTQTSNELVRMRAAYAHDFIPVDAVPAGFFDPVAFGYLSPADIIARPVSAFPDFRAYWLGERFAGAGDLPPLALAQVEQGPDDVGILFTLFYGPAAAPFGHPLVRLQEWPRATWEARPEVRQDPPCTVTEEFALPAGRATILMRVAPPVPPPPPSASPDPGACPAGPYTSFHARAFFGETVVFVIGDGPYNSRAGIELVLRALQPRVAAATPALPGLPNTGGGAMNGSPLCDWRTYRAAAARSLRAVATLSSGIDRGSRACRVGATSAADNRGVRPSRTIIAHPPVRGVAPGPPAAGQVWVVPPPALRAGHRPTR